MKYQEENSSTVETFLLKGETVVRVLDKSPREELHDNYNIPCGMVLFKLLGVTTSLKFFSKINAVATEFHGVQGKNL